MIHKPTFKYMFMSHYATEVCKCPLYGHTGPPAENNHGVDDVEPFSLALDEEILRAEENEVDKEEDDDRQQ